MVHAHWLLRTALLANALFSAMAASTLGIWPDLLADKLGLFGPGTLRLLALCLGFFSAHLFWVARGSLMRRKDVIYFCCMDVAWVIASVIMLVAPNQLSAAGQLAVPITALVVADFAFLQIWGFKKSIS